jgi:hypothetical protein
MVEIGNRAGALGVALLLAAGCVHHTERGPATATETPGTGAPAESPGVGAPPASGRAEVQVGYATKLVDSFREQRHLR